MTPRDISQRLLAAAVSTPSVPPAPWATDLAADIASCRTIHQVETAIGRQLAADAGRVDRHSRARAAVLESLLRWIDARVEDVARGRMR